MASKLWIVFGVLLIVILPEISEQNSDAEDKIGYSNKTSNHKHKGIQLAR